MAPHCSTFAWKIPWTEEPGRLQSTGWLSWTRLRDFTFTFHFHVLEKENGSPLQYSCLENPRDGSLVGCHLRGHTELDTTDVT